MLTAAGFVDVSVEPKAESCEFVDEWDPDCDPSDYVVSTTITGKKPRPEDSVRDRTGYAPRWRSCPVPALTAP